MLILSRREAEKVLFPALGISIEVTRIYGRTVRLGIEAPEEIRIIRDELEDTGGPEIKQPKRNLNHGSDHSWDPPQDIQKCLDAANLAIHLAQNQLRQRLHEKADEALEHALQCLDNLETAASQGMVLETNATPVRESKSRYHTRTDKVALVVDEYHQMRDTLKHQLSGWGYTILQLDNGTSLIEFLRCHDQPNLVLTLQPHISEVVCNDQPSTDSRLDFFDSNEMSTSGIDRESVQSSHPGLRIPGVDGLQKYGQTCTWGDYSVTGWFADPADADVMASCFG